MDRAVPSVRAVVVQDQVIGSLHFGKGYNSVPDRFGQLRIVAFAQYPGDRLLQHPDPGFDDHDRDDRTEPGLQGDMEDEENAGSHKR